MQNKSRKNKSLPGKIGIIWRIYTPEVPWKLKTFQVKPAPLPRWLTYMYGPLFLYFLFVVFTVSTTIIACYAGLLMVLIVAFFRPKYKRRKWEAEEKMREKADEQDQEITLVT